MADATTPITNAVNQQASTAAPYSDLYSDLINAQNAMFSPSLPQLQPYIDQYGRLAYSYVGQPTHLVVPPVTNYPGRKKTTTHLPEPGEIPGQTGGGPTPAPGPSPSPSPTPTKIKAPKETPTGTTDSQGHVSGMAGTGSQAATKGSYDPSGRQPTVSSPDYGYGPNSYISLGKVGSGLLSAASIATPSPYNLVPTAVGLGMRTYNTMNTNAIRESLGLPDLGVGGFAGGMVGTNQYGSLIGNQTIAMPGEFGTGSAPVTQGGLYYGNGPFSGYFSNQLETAYTPQEKLLRNESATWGAPTTQSISPTSTGTPPSTTGGITTATGSLLSPTAPKAPVGQPVQPVLNPIETANQQALTSLGITSKAISLADGTSLYKWSDGTYSTDPAGLSPIGQNKFDAMKNAGTTALSFSDSGASSPSNTSAGYGVGGSGAGYYGGGQISSAGFLGGAGGV